MMKEKNIVIIGGGPAGLAAATAAYDNGEKDILILERDECLGGILNQCIHNGFGLHTFKEELTGPEYAGRFIEKVNERNIEYKLNSIVIDISMCENSDEKIVTYMNSSEGAVSIKAKAIVLAMGCRERPRGALNIPGYRPSGIYTAGTAQKFVNIDGKSVGKRVVILGSGDIGLIMARRMVLEGAEVLAVAELMPYSGGLERNIVQCLKDYNIPLMLSHTISKIYGKDRVTGVDIAEVDENRRVIPGTEVHFDCDTLLLSCGLLPENELSRLVGVELSNVTGGPVVSDNMETSVPGVFASGNVLHVHDLVDYVSEESSRAGIMASEYVSSSEKYKTYKSCSSDIQNLNEKKQVQINVEGGIRYTVPQFIRPDLMEDKVTVRFRVGNTYKNKNLCIYVDGVKIRSMKKNVLKPGEMEQVVLLKKDIDKDVTELKITLEDI